MASDPAFEMARDDIMTAFSRNFTPHSVFVVTWNGVQGSDLDSGEVGNECMTVHSYILVQSDIIIWKCSLEDT